MNLMPKIFLLLFLAGCATTQKPQYTWSKEGGDVASYKRDQAICKARGYEVAGPLPAYQQAPDCKTGFACGYEKASISSANRKSKEVWESAFNSGQESCMYERGYILLPVNEAGK